jgi:cation diffusion facilitator family transporter
MNQNCKVCGSEEDGGRSTGESRATAVSIITLVTMAAEIGFGVATGSMALLADGIHMGTHALALFITVLAYLMARRHHANPAFTFGTGKVGVLGGYTNAILLGITALFMVYESVNRLLHPAAIRFDEAILVAVIGLAVNLVCALLLNRPGSRGRTHDHGHGQAPAHGHDHGHAHPDGAGGSDANLAAAFMHVVADAMTSVLAIAALFSGKYLGWSFLDAAVGLLGAALILRWSFGLLRDTGGVLLDFGDYNDEMARIRSLLEAQGGRVRDIHIWRYSENERSLMLTVQDPRGRSPEEIRALLGDAGGFSHVTVEVCAE